MPDDPLQDVPDPVAAGDGAGGGGGRVRAVAEAARELDWPRRGYSDRAGTDAATLKTRTLTKMYNQRPTWLAHTHAALNRAVWGA